jgi:hypothetical protein
MSSPEERCDEFAATNQDRDQAVREKIADMDRLIDGMGDPPARTNPLLEVLRGLWAWLTGRAERRVEDSDEGIG